MLWLCGTLSAQQDLVITGDVVDVSGCDPLAKTGSIEIRVEGGVSPYTYRWEKVGTGILQNTTAIINGLDTGRYVVKVFHNNGMDSKSREFVITAPEFIKITNVEPQDVLCKGNPTGIITVHVTGGGVSHNYTLLNEDKTVNNNTSGAVSGIFTELPANVYYVAVANIYSCTDIVNVTISEPEKYITLSAVQSDRVSCTLGNDGVISVTISGGVSRYHLDILNTGNIITYSTDNLEAGTHTFYDLIVDNHTSVKITDANNCTESTVLDVREMNKPDMLEPEIVPIKCYNDKGTITINAKAYNENSSGNNVITDYWIEGKRWPITEPGPNNKFEHLNGDIYTLYARDSYGCVGVKEVVLPEPNSPVALLRDEGKIIYPHGNEKGSITLTASGGWGGYTIECILIGSGGYYNTLETRTNVPLGYECTFPDLEAGEYIFTIKDNVCARQGFHQHFNDFFDQTTGEIDLEAADLKIFPNPSSDGKFIIEWSSSENRNVTLELYNIKGQLIYKTNTQTGTGARTALDISNQSRGIYLLHVPELNIRQKIIVN